VGIVARVTAADAARARRPVISVGNLAMGGRGKTPTVAWIARELVDAGERPAILSRGYRRRQPEDGVVIVSDGRHLRADLDRSGDEPLMLARRVPEAAVLVSEVRAVAAAVAETALDVTVHVLDDGFQHRVMARDVDIVLVTPSDLDDRRLPFGRLRSPVSDLAQADAVVVDEGDAERVGERLATVCHGIAPPVFTLHRQFDQPWWLEAPEGAEPPAPGEPVVAVAGIARPERFARLLESAGWTVADRVGFADHHDYRPRDLARIASVAAGRPVVTTEKDAMRLLPHRPLPFRAACLPLAVSIEPAATFRAWLRARLAEVRS
jgi:tetraacyldisaccharide 4'-kinase